MAVIKRKGSKNYSIVIYNPSTKKHKWISSGTDDYYEAVKMEADMQAIVKKKRQKDRIEAFIEEMTEVEVKKPGLRIDDAWNAFFAKWGKERAPGTTRQKGNHFKRCLKWIQENTAGVEYMSEITKELIEMYSDFLYETEKSANYNKIKNNCSNVWDHLVGVSSFDIKSNPWDKIRSKAGDGKKRTHRAFTAEEIHLIRQYLKKDSKDKALAKRLKLEDDEIIQHKYDNWLLVFELAAYTGLRQNDCVLLQWGDIHLDKNVMMIDPGKTKDKKTNNRVNVPIHPKIKTLFKTLEPGRENEWVFPQLAPRYLTQTKQICAVWPTILKTLEISGSDRYMVSFKSIRHYFNTELQKKKISQEIRRKLTGHSSNEINDIYSHDFEAVRDAIMQLD